MENKFDSTISKLLNEMILSTSTQKPQQPGLAPTTQNTNPTGNITPPEQKVTNGNPTPNNSNQPNSQTNNSTAPKHWLDDALEKIQSGQLTAQDLAGLDGVKNLDPKAKALLIQALAHQSA